jgi:hypothetical protein
MSDRVAGNSQNLMGSGHVERIRQTFQRHYQNRRCNGLTQDHAHWWNLVLCQYCAYSSHCSALHILYFRTRAWLVLKMYNQYLASVLSVWASSLKGSISRVLLRSCPSWWNTVRDSKILVSQLFQSVCKCNMSLAFPSPSWEFQFISNLKHEISSGISHSEKQYSPPPKLPGTVIIFLAPAHDKNERIN